MVSKKKKEPSWEEIGKSIGKKFEKYKETECSPWKKPWMYYHETNGGGLGRLIFIIGALYALNYAGMLANIPTWILVLIAIGFTLMKF